MIGDDANGLFVGDFVGIVDGFDEGVFVGDDMGIDEAIEGELVNVVG